MLTVRSRQPEGRLGPSWSLKLVSPPNPSWQTEVQGFDPDHLLHMRFVEGPMKGGSVTYRIEPVGAGSRVSIRNTGPGPQIMGWFVKRSVGILRAEASGALSAGGVTPGCLPAAAVVSNAHAGPAAPFTHMVLPNVGTDVGICHVATVPTLSDGTKLAVRA